ncbi:2-C-methyl-D-erythritol 4-phosphate cytidylyltransferase [Erysipelothrix sp. HDW6C]|uniref:IspD/TarI family cytidylyltransferase n=1 Tax=Erysipelothrix sp. HDW6C TaxID=2714930 RepID=UPI00140E0F7D|nr:2-C-methyl-D-erythritol 4-phosphate cytidylyltransferase [Erysipelothrix sp. HDW6C]QIK68931.1 2-C-methyl-D-erythritol 4-phosphate cytidylyltransferase [Erysipelothrix sp. HDW6C]
MDYSVLLIAAGKRAGEGQSYEKALASFDDSKSVLGQTISIFLNDEKCKQIVIVTSPADMRKVVQTNGSGKIVYVKGGVTRQESVLIGLTAISEDVVLIHDGVRPWVKQSLINKLMARMDVEKACVLAIRPRGTMHRVVDGYIVESVDTTEYMVTQTPQAFQTSFIIDCYRKALRDGVHYNDDAAVVAAVSDQPIAVEKGDIRNARFILKQEK